MPDMTLDSVDDATSVESYVHQDAITMSALRQMEESAQTALRRAYHDQEMTALIMSMVESHHKVVSRLSEAETDARRAEQEANRTLRLKDEAAKAKSMFLANVSHELRTPLNGMIGMSELLKQTEMSTKQSDYVESIRVCGDTLLQVINDILDFSKIEAGKMRMFNVAFSLREAVPEVVRAVGCMQPAGGNVRTIEQLDLPATLVHGDPVRLHQIFMNLLSNSYKFTQSGSVTVHGRTDREDESSVTITCSVEDTGIGISDEQVKRLFRPFSQADSSTGRKYGGSGLGLSICKSLITIMGGKIWIQSREGQGTTVSFSLTYPKATSDSVVTISDGDPTGSTSATPAKESTDPLAKYSRPVDGGEHATMASLNTPNPDPATPHHLDLSVIPRDQIRIAVAEDNEINSKIAVSFVEKLGLRVDAFDNGQRTVDALRAEARNGTPYHVVLMDVQMPVLDGYKATRLLRMDESKDVREVLIIAMTASAIEGDREKCLAAGMNDYLAKPVRTAVLKRMLDSYLSPDDCAPPTPVSDHQKPSAIPPANLDGSAQIHSKRPTFNSTASYPTSPKGGSAAAAALGTRDAGGVNYNTREEPRRKQSSPRPKANRASTGTPLVAAGWENEIANAEEREGGGQKRLAVRPGLVSRYTAAGRVEGVGRR